MKKLLIGLLFLLLLTSCSKTNNDILLDSNSIGEQNSINNLEYRIDDHLLKSDNFKVNELIGFESYGYYIYLNVEGLQGYDGVFFDDQNNYQLFLDNTKGDGEFLIKVPKEYIEATDNLDIIFWKNDNDRVFFFIKNSNLKLCTDEAKIEEIKAKFPDIFEDITYIDLSNNITIDDSNFKPEIFNIKELYVSIKDNTNYNFVIAIESTDFLNGLFSINCFDTEKGLHDDIVGYLSNNKNVYVGEFLVNLSNYKDIKELDIEIWPNGEKGLSIIIPIDLIEIDSND